jgi:hypothetical protein
MRSAPEAPYVLWIMVSTAGLLQVLSARYGWLGLSFLRGRRRLGYLGGALLVAASYYWFFAAANRNVPGLEGWQLFSRFGAGAAAGLVVTLVLSSVINASLPGAGAEHVSAGLDSLKTDSYAHLLMGELRRVLAGGKRPHG